MIYLIEKPSAEGSSDVVVVCLGVEWCRRAFDLMSGGDK